MQIIDAHIHYSNLLAFHEAAKQSGVDYSKAGLVAEMQHNNIVAGIVMGLSETQPGAFPDVNAITPMGYDLDILPQNCFYCIGINPENLDPAALNRLETELRNPKCAGIKIYAGYYHHLVTSNLYDPVYLLTHKYNLPVVIHSGDTYSERGLLKYSHPLVIDELAVKYPDMKIVIAHLGNPWLMDTAEILYKNRNVYADLSGLLVGDKALFDRFMGQELYLNMFRTALILADRYDKLLFGTDWPLSQIDTYIEFIQKLIPTEHHSDVFYGNAIKVFSKLKEAVNLDFVSNKTEFDPTSIQGN